MHIQADDCLSYNGKPAKKQVWSFLTCLALLKVMFDELNHCDLKEQEKKCQEAYIFVILVHIQADYCLFYNGKPAKKQAWSFLTYLALLKARFDELNHYDLKEQEKNVNRYISLQFLGIFKPMIVCLTMGNQPKSKFGLF